MNNAILSINTEFNGVEFVSSVLFTHRSGVAPDAAPVRSTISVAWDRYMLNETLQPIGHAAVGPITLSDNPVSREIEDALITRVCVDVFGRSEHLVNMVVEHRLLAQQGRGRGGRCAELYRHIKNLTTHNGSIDHMTGFMASLGDRQAIAYQLQTAKREPEPAPVQEAVTVEPLTARDKVFAFKVKGRYDQGELIPAAQRRRVADIARHHADWIRELGLPTDGGARAWGGRRTTKGGF